MFLELRLGNFKSFRNCSALSMVPSSVSKDSNYRALKRRIKGIGKTQEALCSTVLYGANASGKSNVIAGAELLRSIVLRGNILDTAIGRDAFESSSFLSLAPTASDSEETSVLLGITFLIDSLKVEYTIQIELGPFLARSYERKIVFEKLLINEEAAFERTRDDVTFFPLPELMDGKRWDEKEYRFLEKLCNANINSKELFLTNGFKSIVSPSVASKILSWFRDRFIIIRRFEDVPLIDERINNTHLNLMSKAANLAGSQTSAFTFDNSQDGRLCLHSLFMDKDGKTKMIPSEIFESSGTVRFMQLLPIIFDTLENGKFLLIDEFDTSIHPLALMEIIHIFHNDELNKHGSQLVFTTHNPIFLNTNIFLRDEIKFVHKENNNSFIYSLAESGKRAVESTDDSIENYLSGQYGTNNQTHISQLFVNYLKEKENQ